VNSLGPERIEQKILKIKKLMKKDTEDKMKIDM
jgi:hypothetical protein